MSEIKTVYLDNDGNQHETKAAARKANRVIDAFDVLHGSDMADAVESLVSNKTDFKVECLIEFARAVVAIYGMKDKD